MCLVLTETAGGTPNGSTNAYFVSTSNERHFYTAAADGRGGGRRPRPQATSLLLLSLDGGSLVYDLTCKGYGNALNIKRSDAFYDGGKHEFGDVGVLGILAGRCARLTGTSDGEWAKLLNVIIVLLSC